MLPVELQAAVDESALKGLSLCTLTDYCRDIVRATTGETADTLSKELEALAYFLKNRSQLFSQHLVHQLSLLGPSRLCLAVQNAETSLKARCLEQCGSRVFAPRSCRVA